MAAIKLLIMELSGICLLQVSPSGLRDKSGIGKCCFHSFAAPIRQHGQGFRINPVLLGKNAGREAFFIIVR